MSLCKTHILYFVVLLFAFTTYHAKASDDPTCPKGMGWNYNVSTPESSTSYSPKIKINAKLCFCVFCMKDSFTLHWAGDCKYAFKFFKRFCARIASPGEHGNADTKFPRLGVYEDPSFFEDPSDILDILTDSQIFQENEGTPSTTSTFNMVPDIGVLMKLMKLTKLWKSMGVPKEVYQPLDTIIVSSLMIILLPITAPVMAIAAVSVTSSALNSSGTDTDIKSKPNVSVKSLIGMVDIPPPPSPPPFCPEIIKLPYDVVTEKICSAVTYPESYSNSTYDSICQKGENGEYSTFEKPMIRVGFNNQITYCGSGLKQDNCIDEFKNIVTDSYTDQQDIFATYNGLLSTCSGNDPCVKFGTTAIGRYRTLFSNPDNNTTGNTQTYWFDDDDVNLVLTGVDYSDYTDLTSGYEYHNHNEKSKVIESDFATVSDPDSTDRKFYATMSDDGTQICAYEASKKNNSSKKDILVGCQDRADMPIPIVASCGKKICYSNSDSACIDEDCDTTHYKPKMVVGLGNPIQYDVVAAEEKTDDGLNLVTLHGVELSAYVTDEYNSLPNNKGNLKGTYDIDGDYAGGLEYSDGVYVRGGKYMCINGYSSPYKILSFLDDNNLPSQNISDRIIPTYVAGTATLNDNQYYRPTEYATTYNSTSGEYESSVSYEGDTIYYDGRPSGSSTTVDPLYEGIRGKNALELGLCVPVPSLYCSSDKENGLSWDDTDVGNTASVSCDSGYGGNSADGKVTRKCIYPKSKGVVLNATGIAYDYNKVTNGGAEWADPSVCYKDCEAESSSESNYYTSWAQTSVGKTAIATGSSNSNCDYTAVTRACVANTTTGKGVWGTPSSSCVDINCKAESSSSSNGYADWPSTAPSQTAIATGSSYSSCNYASITRKCNLVNGVGVWAGPSKSCKPGIPGFWPNNYGQSGNRLGYSKDWWENVWSVWDNSLSSKISGKGNMCSLANASDYITYEGVKINICRTTNYFYFSINGVERSAKTTAVISIYSSYDSTLKTLYKKSSTTAGNHPE